MMKKMIPVLIAAVFSAGAFAQAVTTKPGEAMGPTGTNSQSTGASRSTGMPIKGGQGAQPGSAVTVKPGDAMGPTSTTATMPGNAGSGSMSSGTHMRDKSGKSEPAVTIQQGGAMGPTGATSAGPKK